MYQKTEVTEKMFLQAFANSQAFTPQGLKALFTRIRDLESEEGQSEFDPEKLADTFQEVSIQEAIARYGIEPTIDMEEIIDQINDDSNTLIWVTPETLIIRR